METIDLSYGGCEIEKFNIKILGSRTCYSFSIMRKRYFFFLKCYLTIKLVIYFLPIVHLLMIVEWHSLQNSNNKAKRYGEGFLFQRLRN